MDETFKAELTEFIVSELNQMAQKIKTNYLPNVENRRKNCFLCLNEDVQKYMALGRSVDSQLGNRIQRIIFYLTRVKYGINAVPNYTLINTDEDIIKVSTYSIPYNLDKSEQNAQFNPFNQYVLFNTPKSEREIKNALKVKASSSSLINKEYSIIDAPAEIINTINSYSKHKPIPVDLLYFEIDADNLTSSYAYEIKMGGNLDTKNSQSNANEVKKLKDYFLFLDNSNSYFATCYGNCSEAVRRQIINQVGENSIVENKDFWEKVLPTEEKGITYDEFLSIYKDAFESSEILKTINEL